MSDASRSHFNEKMFHGYDFDNTMLRIGSMNMLLHGVENPAIDHKDSLSEEASGDIELYDLVLANPPLADYRFNSGGTSIFTNIFGINRDLCSGTDY
jgi:type I restriction-modification system DNA methylase subunit